MHKNLRFRSEDGLDIDLSLRGDRIVIEGDSATGKTYLWKQLNTQGAESVYPVCYENIKNNNSYEAVLRFISENKGVIVVIDQANEYILFGRDLEIEHNLSEIATLEIKNGRATLTYKFPEVVR